MDIEKTLQRYEKAFRKLGIAFCPICEELHNTRSNLHADLDGYIHFSLTNEESVYVCPGCALAWAKRRKRLISNRKFGFALAHRDAVSVTEQVRLRSRVVDTRTAGL